MPDGFLSKSTEAQEPTLPPEGGKASSKTQVVNIAALAQRVNDPSIVRREYSTQMSKSDLISHIPWQLKISGVGSDSEEQEKVTYPNFTYLDLRRSQNSAWATSRLHDGVHLAKSGKLKEAETCYKEGLELDPSHAQLLVAYGALCANLGRVDEGIVKLKRALEIDPEVTNGQKYLTAIQHRRREIGIEPKRNEVSSRNLARSIRSDAALRDAEAENALHSQTAKNEAYGKSDPKNEKYPLLSDSTCSDVERDNEKKKKKKKRKKKHRKRERHVSYSDESSDGFRKTRRKKKRKRR